MCEDGPGSCNGGMVVGGCGGVSCGVCGGVDACVSELGDACGVDGCVWFPEKRKEKKRKEEGLGRKVNRASDGIMVARRVKIVNRAGRGKVRERQTSREKEEKRIE